MSNEQALRDALSELFALVMGECRQLLDEDSGGNSALYMEIQEALAMPKAAPVDERDKVDAERYRWLADSNNYYEAIELISDGSLTEDALGQSIDAARGKK